jgi:hypothetical protein
MKILAAVIAIGAVVLAILSWALKPNPVTEAVTVVILPLLSNTGLKLPQHEMLVHSVTW